MVALRLSSFSGAMPIRDQRLLPDETPVYAANVSTDGGALKGIHGTAEVTDLDPDTRFVYRLPYVAGTPDPVPVDPYNLTAGTWLEFEDIYTNVLRTPNINDSFQRYYWASPSTGFKYATLADLLAGGPSAGIGVGIEVPLTPLVVVATGGDPDGPTTTRAYMQTFVSIYGEEGQPGPATDASGKSDGDWVISSIDQPVNAAGTTEIDRIRIYRTITASSGTTTFFLVKTLPVGTTTLNDDLSDAIVSANTQLESTLWAPPPEGLMGVVAMPNGIFVGWKGNTLYFSENYRPHAWPAEYAVTVQFPIVGLGVYGSTCVVCTTGYPATVTGIKASVMTLVQGKVSMPCTSRLGIISALEGVYFPSEDGIILVAPAGLNNMTNQVIAKDQWGRDFDIHGIKAAMNRGIYVAMRPNTAPTDGYMLPLGGQPTTQFGVVEVDMDIEPLAIGVDEWSGRVWIITEASELIEWENILANRVEHVWRSKEVNLPTTGNLSAYQVFFDKSSPPGSEGVWLKVWADGRLVYDYAVPEPQKTYRLPSGFTADIWQFELTSRTRIHNFNVASTITELSGV